MNKKDPVLVYKEPIFESLNDFQKEKYNLAKKLLKNKDSEITHVHKMETMTEEKAFPMGKEFNCHHGAFVLPSTIYGIGIYEDHLNFHCEDGIYVAERKDKWEIRKTNECAIE